MSLSKPMEEGITNINRQPGSPTEHDVYEAAESKMQDQIQGWRMVCLQLQEKRNGGFEPLFVLNSGGDKAAPEDDEVCIRGGVHREGGVNALVKHEGNVAEGVASVWWVGVMGEAKTGGGIWLQRT